MTERFARIPERAIRCRDLSATDWRVLACILLHADEVGRAYPGMTTIAKMAGIRRQDVPRTIRRLEQMNLIRCEPGGGPNGANLYTMLDDTAMVSAPVRTVRNAADPQGCGGGVRNAATNVSAPLRTKQTIEQTNKQTPPRKRAERYFATTVADVQFEELWRTIPKRDRDPKKPARQEFLAALMRGADPKLILAAAETYAAEEIRRGTSRRYIVKAAKWLKEERWEQYAVPDEPEPLRAGMI